jgi:hypothetical protein
MPFAPRYGAKYSMGTTCLIGKDPAGAWAYEGGEKPATAHKHRAKKVSRFFGFIDILN